MFRVITVSANIYCHGRKFIHGMGLMSLFLIIIKALLTVSFFLLLVLKVNELLNYVVLLNG